MSKRKTVPVASSSKAAPVAFAGDAWRAKLEPHERAHAARLEAHARRPMVPAEVNPITDRVIDLEAAIAAAEAEQHRIIHGYVGDDGKRVEPEGQRSRRRERLAALDALREERAAAGRAIDALLMPASAPVPDAEHERVAKAAQYSAETHAAYAEALAAGDMPRARRELICAIIHDDAHGIDVSAACAALAAMDAT